LCDQCVVDAATIGRIAAQTDSFASGDVAYFALLMIFDSY
jgi:hypothetical protein